MILTDLDELSDYYKNTTPRKPHSDPSYKLVRSRR